MRWMFLTATLLAAQPALALQHPDGSKNPDPHVCDVTYNPDDVVNVPAIEGMTVTIRFGATDKIANVSPSDTVHLKYFLTENANLLWLKATQPMPSQPISIRTLKEDGTPRDYTLQWTALSDVPQPVQVASNGDVKVQEVQPSYCYLIRFKYGQEFTKAQVDAWKARKAKERDDADEIALHRAATSNAGKNKRYVAQGDASIAPTEIWDDGNSTWLRFAGNISIPVLLKRMSDGKDGEITGTTTEQGGIVKIHGTLPFIRLRDGDLTLCITNLGYTREGNNPGTGTVAPSVTRDIRTVQ